MLGKLGYQVTSQTCSLEALKVFKLNPEQFDLVISDMTMPNMTGVQLAHEIKAIRTNIPIIICSGFSELINENNYTDLGIDAYIVKPIIKKDLAQSIRAVLDKSSTI